MATVWQMCDQTRVDCSFHTERLKVTFITFLIIHCKPIINFAIESLLPLPP